MRALLHLKENCSDSLVIWPFDEVDNRRSVIVEVFPRYFPLLYKLSPKMSDLEALNDALAAFDSERAIVPPASEDEGDALITAAALRSISKKDGFFELPGASVRNQGWIFGVPVGGAT